MTTPNPEPIAASGLAPVISIIRGRPSPAELAAVTAVLTARAAAANKPSALAPAPRSAWADRSRLVREAIAAGPGAWRVSFLPR